MKPTLSNIAKKAGVSVSTASLVMSRKGKISTEVQKKVRDAAKELGYEKSTLRKPELVKKAAVLFHFDHRLAHTWNLLRRITLKIQECLDARGFATLVIPISYDMSDQDLYRRVRQSGAEAVFSMHFGREELFERLESEGIPVVLIINSQFQTKFHTVCADNFQGSYEAAAYLTNLGHRNIVYAEFDIFQLPATISDRFLGFYKAMQEHGIPLPKENHLQLEIWDFEDIRKKFTRVFKRNNRPTAVFFVDDYLAVHCTGVIKDMGLSIPEDISIIAAGEVLDFNEPFTPPITAMSTNPELLGKYSAEMLFSILEQTHEDNYVLKIKQQLEYRGSCRPV
ncbi:MAG: LacI family transcriptional regulator [Planctomycetes bacterium]|nr:LacI family transcriptional regulator [Planctomycetota bacterium]